MGFTLLQITNPNQDFDAHMNRLSSLNAIPPIMIAVPLSAIVTAVAFLHPNSDAIASILARHGMYIMLTSANTIN